MDKMITLAKDGSLHARRQVGTILVNLQLQENGITVFLCLKSAYASLVRRWVFLWACMLAVRCTFQKY